MGPIRIVLVDDHTVVRAGLRLVIESTPTMMVVGEAGTSVEALDTVARVKPDLVLLELRLGDENGSELIPDLLAALPGIHVLALTGVRDPDAQLRAILYGAMGLVLKSRSVSTLLTAIERVHAGEVWFDRGQPAAVLRERECVDDPSAVEAAARIASLSAREREVIRLVLSGMSNREVAQRLSISGTTVRHHLTSSFSKLNVADRTELMLFANRRRAPDDG